MLRGGESVSTKGVIPGIATTLQVLVLHVRESGQHELESMGLNFFFKEKTGSGAREEVRHGSGAVGRKGMRVWSKYNM